MVPWAHNGVPPYKRGLDWFGRFAGLTHPSCRHSETQTTLYVMTPAQAISE